jgi:hypothetical protein
MPAGTFFTGDCRGYEGGGGLDEKLLRFRRFKEYALDLQNDIDKISKIDAVEQLTEVMWDAPLLRVHGSRIARIKTNRAFNIPTNAFSPNFVPVAETGPNLVYPNAVKPGANSALTPVVRRVENGAENSIGMANSGNVIFFKHRQPNGTVYDHEEKNTGIGIEILIGLVKDKIANFGNETFLYCYGHDSGCKGLFWPEDLKGIIPDDLYSAYREIFNRKYGDKFGTAVRAGAGAGAGGAGAGGVGVEERKNNMGGGGKRSRTHRNSKRGRATEKIKGGGGGGGGGGGEGGNGNGSGTNILTPAVNAVCILQKKTGGKRRSLHKNTHKNTHKRKSIRARARARTRMHKRR